MTTEEFIYWNNKNQHPVGIMESETPFLAWARAKKNTGSYGLGSNSVPVDKEVILESGNYY